MAKEIYITNLRTNEQCRMQFKNNINYTNFLTMFFDEKQIEVLNSQNEHIKNVSYFQIVEYEI